MPFVHSLASGIFAAWVSTLSLGLIIWAVERLLPKSSVSLKSQLRALQFWLLMGLGTGLAVTLYAYLGTLLQPRPIVIIPLTKWLANPWLHWSLYVIAPILAVILYDFFDYWMHRAQHKWFWRFHAVHHSIEELSGINSYFHWTEQFFRIAFISLPAAYLVGIDGAETVFVAELLVRLQGYYLHSPTSIHFGRVMRRLFADNRFHRIHHSIHPQHFDKNFGAGTTLWDQLFGTAYFPAGDEWPATGMAELPEARTPSAYLWGPFMRTSSVGTRALERQNGNDDPLASELHHA